VEALKETIENFLSHLRIERRLSPNTTDSYLRDLSSLIQWMPSAGFADWQSLNGEALRSFLASEHRRGLGAKSLQRRLSACRSLFQWQLKHGQLKGNPAQGIRAPKAARKLPQVLDPDEMARLVEVPTDTELGKRDRAMLELFYSSGLRLSELCSLHWRDLDLADGLVRVLGKGSKVRIVPVGKYAREALENWRTRQYAAHVELRVLRGEDLDALSREVGVTAGAIAGWRDQVLLGGQAAVRSRPVDERDDEIARLRAKIGELTMDNELLRDRARRAEATSPFAPRRLRK